MSRWLATAAIAIGACGGHAGHDPVPPRGVKAAEPQPRDQMSLTPTTLTPDIVLAKIRAAYMGGVKRCYSVLLKNHGSARGKVMITFTVDPNGRTQRGEAHGFADGVDACIASQIVTWRFPLPKDGAGVPVEASFALPLDLVPD